MASARDKLAPTELMAFVDSGTLLGGKYQLERLIGRGGMGSVWRAQHLGLGAPVAVKLLDLPGTSSSGVRAKLPPSAIRRFQSEAQAAASIRSPHVVQILDHGVEEALGAPFIVMELLEGESLAQRLARTKRLTHAETAQVVTHICRALSRVHDAGMVHRDLKPDNVFLVTNEDEFIAKVLDFGIAKADQNRDGSHMLTGTGDVMGTAFYMSPEQLRGSKDVDFRTDLWALGVLACQCLTGKLPFYGDTLADLTMKICADPIPRPSTLAAVPAGFDAWFLRSVERDPSARFASAREAADQLRALLPGESVDRSSLVDAPADATAVAPAGMLTASIAPSGRGVWPTTSVPVSSSDAADPPLSASAVPGLTPLSTVTRRVVGGGAAALALVVAGALFWGGNTSNDALGDEAASAEAASPEVASGEAANTASGEAANTASGEAANTASGEAANTASGEAASDQSARKAAAPTARGDAGTTRFADADERKVPQTGVSHSVTGAARGTQGGGAAVAVKPATPQPMAAPKPVAAANPAPVVKPAAPKPAAAPKPEGTNSELLKLLNGRR